MISGVNPASVQMPRMPKTKKDPLVTIPGSTISKSDESSIKSSSASSGRDDVNPFGLNEPKSFFERVKGRWSEYGIGAIFKAISDTLVGNPYKSLSKLGIIGWIKAIISLPMELIASPLGFFSKLVMNTGTELKNLIAKTEKGKKPEQSFQTSSVVSDNTEEKKDSDKAEQKYPAENPPSARDLLERQNNPTKQ